MTLYEINKNIADLLNNSVDPETGEIAEDFFIRLSELQEAKDEKVENIGLYIKNLTAEATACKAEAKSFTDRAKAAENKAEWLKGYVTSMLEEKPFKSNKIAITFRRSQAVEVTDITKLGSDFFRIKEPEIDKAKIKDALKAGEKVEGAELVERVNISIK